MIAKNAFSDRRRRFSLFLYFGNGVVALELFFVLLGLVKAAAVHFRAEAAVNTLAHHAGGKLRLDLCDLVLEELPRLPRFSARAGAIGIALKKDFGYGKNVLDLGCVALSIAITLIFSGRISNIGIGTVLSMLVTGRIVKLFSAPTGKLYEKVS